ncbi:MAG TPA: SAM-dependent methyltransferase [Methanoregula sp.]|nr:SAM-dependent methyltransferase [Methanoregula sp.]
MTGNEFFSGEIQIEPIGIVKNDVEQPPLVAKEDGLHLNAACGSPVEQMGERLRISEIVLASHLSGLLEGIDEYSHLVILYWGHAVPPHDRSLVKTHPAGLVKYPKQGIYATCSPARPNPILMKVVRLVKRDGTHLFVEGLDAIDQSPVLDIKPYVADMYPQEDVRIPAWMADIMKEFHGP